MKNIFYIHGFGSSSKGATATKLKHYFPMDYVIGLDYCSAAEFKTNLDNLINQVDSLKFHECLFIGTSLGGLYAKFLSDHFHVGCVLINPVVEPKIQLRQFLGENINFSSHQCFVFSKNVLRTYGRIHSSANHCGMVVYSSTTDKTLVDGFERVEKQLRNCLIIPTTTEHRISSFNDLPGFRQHVTCLYDNLTCQLNI